MSNIEIKEMVEISQHTFFIDNAEICDKIMREFYKTHSLDGRPRIPKEYCYDWLCLISTIFNAGKVQGIRSERARRKAKVKSGE